MSIWNIMDKHKCFIVLLSFLSVTLVSPFPNEDLDDPDLETEFINPSSTSVRLDKQDDICNCTSFFQCDLDASPTGGGINKEGMSPETSDEDENGADVGVIDIRNGFTSTTSTSSCKHYLEICCNHYQRTSKPRKPAEPKVPVQPSESCGRRNVHGVGFRIVGDDDGEAQMGEFTWMIAVTELTKDRHGTIYLCGGSLIHPRVVVTAAHCLENKSPESLRIRAGEWDTQTEREDPFIHHDRHVSKLIMHEDYSKRTVLKNDIALLVLSKDVPIARHIGPVCLSADLKPTQGQRCFASGWGKNLYGKEGSYQSILKKIDLPAIPNRACQSLLRETRLGPRFRLHESFVCAGGEKGKDTCKGDGGSPLVCEIPGSDSYALYGIVSWGLNCGDPVPGVYVNVPHFVPWIEERMKELGLDSSSFKAI
ncbi:Serine protease 42 [Orchesella cincta]|uniref:Phenoloxidase-activating factor 2 n=1 Tax=Orchesella cincta TaxID=48709 RepID=A0A1D2MXF9_ORCCI|nr:Serine protease 42 [Orchesella cincta]